MCPTGWNPYYTHESNRKQEQSLTSLGHSASRRSASCQSSTIPRTHARCSVAAGGFTNKKQILCELELRAARSIARVGRIEVRPRSQR